MRALMNLVAIIWAMAKCQRPVKQHEAVCCKCIRTSVLAT